MLKAAKGIAIGQSIGNPNVRLDGETSELLDNHLSIILDHPENLKNKKEGEVKIAFPIKNFDLERDGITQLTCALMGGQMDIEVILGCRLIDVATFNSWLYTLQITNQIVYHSLSNHTS